MGLFEYDEEKHNRSLREEGREEEHESIIKKMLNRGKTPEAISEFSGEDINYVRGVQKSMMMVNQDSGYNA